MHRLSALAIRRAVLLTFVWVCQALLLEQARLERLLLAPPTITRSATGSSSASSTCTATFSGTVASNVRIVVLISRHVNDTTTVDSITDSLGTPTTYSQDQISTTATGRRAWIWSGLTVTSGADPVVTVTSSAATSLVIWCHELSNAATVDTANKGGTTSTAASTSHNCSTSKTLTSEGIVFGAATTAANAGGFTDGGVDWTSDSPNIRSFFQYRTAPDAAETGPFTTGASSTSVACMQSYETPAAGGGSGSIFGGRAFGRGRILGGSALT